MRRPFSLEVKQRGRSATAEPKSPSGLWDLTDFAEPEPAPPPPAPPRTPAPATAAPAASASRRVLPSLIAPPVAPEPAEPDTPVHEPRLPRVRRVTKAPRPTAVKARVETARPAPVAAPAASRPIPAPAPVQEPPAVPRAVRGRQPRGSETLRMGERWKRRLPRVCW